MDYPMEKFSDKGLLNQLKAYRLLAESLFEAALEAESDAGKIEAEIARRGIVGVAQNDAEAGEMVQVETPPRAGKIIDISSHLPQREPETPEPVMVVPDSNEPQCEGGTTHDWERIRNGPEVLLDSCRLCPVRRWVEITEEGGTLSWNYGSPPPPKQRARMMQEDDELEEGEEWEDADGNVPREITGRQKKLTRVTDGRRVTVDP